MTVQELKDHILSEIERRKKSLRAGICNDQAFTRKQKNEMLVASEELSRLERFIKSEAFTPKEPELTEFEKLFSELIADVHGAIVPLNTDEVKESCQKLMELAKAELGSEESKALRYAIEKSYKIGLRDGKIDGYEKAMKEFKELPALTWPPKPIPTHTLSCPYNTGGCTNPMRDCINCPTFSINTTTGTSTAKVKG